MARVEWTRQAGEDVEAVVAMLLCRRYPNAVRVRPSQGDGGIDVFVPGPSGWGKEREVYQVKRFCENLTSSQKRKIKKSFERVVQASANEGWRITKWHLVMPLDMTSQNFGWLDTIVADAGFPCETNGLVFCDTYAADYPNVVDYYLRDGRERLQEQMNNLTAILSSRVSREPGEALVPADVRTDLAAIHKGLNACDPFYKYDYGVSDNPSPDPSGPGLVAVCAMRHESVWITIKIFARSLAALEERPIGGQFQIVIPKGDDELHEQVQKFIDYGAPLSLPQGTTTGSLDLPAGLGGELTGASLQVVNVVERVGEDDTELAIAMLAPDSDTVIASTNIKRTEFSSGETGFRSIWVDTANLFTIEMLAKTNQGQRELTWHFHTEYDLNGRRPADVVNSLQFLAAMRAPNRIGIGLPYGPREFGNTGTVPAADDDERATKRWAVVADALARIQDHVAVRLLMPAQMSGNQAADIVEAAKLLDGDIRIGPLTGPFTVHHPGQPPQFEREPGKLYEFVVVKALEFVLSDDTISVGKEALFVCGRYIEIADDRSKIEPVSDGVSILYTGEVEVGRVLARHLRGIVHVDAPDNAPAIE